jgi:hypothetical protein
MWQGRGSPFIVSGAESKFMRDIANNGYIHQWKWVAICGYGMLRYGNYISIFRNISIYGIVG